MAKPEHLAVLERGVSAWNDWKENKVLIDLRGANLEGAKLHGINFQTVDLEGANLHRARLHVAFFVGANLVGADFSEADLHWTNFTSADLRNVNLCKADLSAATFRRTKLTGADFNQSKITSTIFCDTDLTDVIGLDSCRHWGPSTLDINTLARSSGLPTVFINRCGLSAKLIEYLPSLVHQAIEFYSCFISYSNHDQAFAERLHADLQAKNLRCWFAPEDLKIGDRFQERIEESISVFDKVMIVLSEASVQSRWVEREVNAAREREDRENRTILFPIRIDDAVMNAPQPWAADVRRSRHIGDFSKWKAHDAYQKAFDRLLRDLKATDRASEQPA
jgi:uncharacterized protein YjbI with pentapeptide repeats